MSEPSERCRHCGEPIVRCPHPAASLPICKGWRHMRYDTQPVGAHYCGGRSVNPSAEPAQCDELDVPAPNPACP